MENAYEKSLVAIQKQLRIKKKVNIFLCYTIFVLGVMAIVYRVNNNGGNFHFEEMTVNGTIFASVFALAYAVVNHIEIAKDKEFECKALYYLRLSSAVTEFIIVLVVFIGLLPFTPDSPLILRFDMAIMHLILPILTIVSFVFHDPPIGKLKPLERCYGLTFLFLYSVGITLCILTGLLPQENIPYSFLEFYTRPIWYTVSYGALIYLGGYLLSWLFSELNRKNAWIWFRGVASKAKPPKAET